VSYGYAKGGNRRDFMASICAEDAVYAVCDSDGFPRTVSLTGGLVHRAPECNAPRAIKKRRWIIAVRSPRK
jgi:hypothetical protein